MSQKTITSRASRITFPIVKDFYGNLFEAVKDLSINHFVYTSRNGLGATDMLKTAFRKSGTFAVLQEQKDKINPISHTILESLATQGSIFATWDEILLSLTKKNFTGFEPLKMSENEGNIKKGTRKKTRRKKTRKESPEVKLSDLH